MSHDEKHIATARARTILSNGCNARHLLLAQSSADKINQLRPEGWKFAHPMDKYDPALQGTDFHHSGR